MGECDMFQNEPDHFDTPRTIVITPLRVTIMSEQSYKISFGCNYWKTCQNKGCSYCQAGMGERLPDV